MMIIIMLDQMVAKTGNMSGQNCEYSVRVATAEINGANSGDTDGYLVGIAIMVENAIVFGNRYRSSYPEIDSELTRAELSFQNGEYTKALKIAIQSIEKMHPGIYEKLIKTNDPSIMNQVG